MPLEALACTSCGSADVQEVKPATYFCNHCDTVFKYVDPGRVTVDQRPSFCSCGNQIQFQCQICENGMCRSCDIVRYPDVSVSVVGFGYLRKIARNTTEWSVVGHQIVKAQLPGPAVIGPFLRVSDILPQLTTAHGYLRHVCCACLAGAVPGTAEAIAAGVICEVPGCGAPPEGSCPCCGAAFCNQGLVLAKTTDGHLSWVQIGLPRTAVCVAVRGYGSDQVHEVRGPDPRGLCSMCAHERASEADKELLEFCEKYPDIVPDSDRSRRIGKYSVPQFRVPTTQKSTARRQRAEQERAKQIVDRWFEAIYAKVKELEQFRSPCKRQQWFADIPVTGQAAGPNDLLDYKYTGYAYGIVDERDRVAPAAAPALTETG